MSRIRRGEDIDRVLDRHLGEERPLQAIHVSPREGRQTSPALESTSVPITAGPPVLVMMPTRLPPGIGWDAKQAAAWKLSLVAEAR